MLMKPYAHNHFDIFAGADDPAGTPDCMNQAGQRVQPIDVLAPIVRDCIRRFGPRDTLSSLAALFVREAIEWRQPHAMALVLDMDAELLRNAVCDEDIDDSRTIRS